MEPDAKKMRDSFRAGVSSLYDCMNAWDDSAIVDYQLDESFEEFLHKLGTGITFKEDMYVPAYGEFCLLETDGGDWSVRAQRAQKEEEDEVREIYDSSHGILLNFCYKPQGYEKHLSEWVKGENAKQLFIEPKRGEWLMTVVSDTYTMGLRPRKPRLFKDTCSPVEVPEWLSKISGMEDTSWHNDACASMMKMVHGGEPDLTAPYIRVAVEAASKREREYLQEGYRYVIYKNSGDEGDRDNGITMIYQGEDEDEAELALLRYLAHWY